MTDETIPGPDLDVPIWVRAWRVTPTSNVTAVGYDEASATLEVRFRTGRYRYGNVTPAEAAPLLTERPHPALLGRESPARYLSRVFVQQPTRHPYIKLGGTPKGERLLMRQKRLFYLALAATVLAAAAVVWSSTTTLHQRIPGELCIAAAAALSVWMTEEVSS